ncbi:hypothetical protein [Candidatus Methanomassiliicoccus intestinalis]|uniref:hypothetical protein n=1 Tax=Candidatus Methanomassiliicoccus intestinalis TaxID=1406512 RepID=UPI0037DC7F47
MSYSTKRPQRNQIMYNKWRMGSVFLNVIGLMLFMFGIGFEENRLLYMVGSVIILWLAFAVTYIYFNRNKGTPLEALARISYVISLFLAVIITVLVLISAHNGMI